MANLTPRRSDLAFDQLVEVLRRQLPHDEWTDHNASDPGIMLLELMSWLAEMTLYRMDRVPASHREKFLNFLIDPPEPVAIDVELTATFQPLPAIGAVIIDAGALVATDFVAGRRTVFETVKPLALTRTAPTGTVRARAILPVFNEALGVSDGSAHQTFELRPPRLALGLTDPDAPAPVLTDFLHRASGYEPNPRVTIGANVWTAVPSLRTEGSRVSGANPARHFMVEPYESRLRFGDGTFGAIPAAGSLVVCDRYAVLAGPEALTVAAGDVRHVLAVTPALPATVGLTVSANSDAEGGANFYPVSRRTELGLRAFRAPYRLITAADFERAILEDFNAFQAQSGKMDRILRTSIAFDRRPPLQDDTEAPSHVTLVLVPGSPDFPETQFRNELVPVATKQAMLTLPTGLWERLQRFLDPRRLITTRLDHDTAKLRAFGMTATVAVAADRSVARVQGELRDRIFGFLSLMSGGFDGGGWRLGRSVYRSQLFRLLEDADGVDHVDSLALSPADADGNVRIAPHELPLLQSLSLTVVRA